MLWNTFFTSPVQNQDYLASSVLQLDHGHTALAEIQYVKAYYLIRYGASNHDFLDTQAQQLFHADLAQVFVTKKLKQQLTMSNPAQTQQAIAMALDFQATYHVPASLLVGFYLDHLYLENDLQAIGWNVYGLSDARGNLRKFRSLHDATVAFIHHTSATYGLELLVKHGKNGLAWAAHIPNARSAANQIALYNLSLLEL